jgi:hypothetical protein
MLFKPAFLLSVMVRDDILGDGPELIIIIYSKTDENENWQPCILWNAKPMFVCPVRDMSVGLWFHKLCDWIMHRTRGVLSVCVSRRKETIFKTFRKPVILHICRSILAKFRFQRHIIAWFIIMNSGPLPSKSPWISFAVIYLCLNKRISKLDVERKIAFGKYVYPK